MSDVVPMKATKTVYVTKDANKLWSCESVIKNQSAKHRGKLPAGAGNPLLVYADPETPSAGAFCQAKIFYRVVPKEVRKFSTQQNTGFIWVCEHQIDEQP